MSSETTTSAKLIDEYFSGLIAEREGISPEEVTVAYIHEQREKRIYPNIRYYSPGLRSFSRNELDQLQEKVDAEIEAILAE